MTHGQPILKFILFELGETDDKHYTEIGRTMREIAYRCAGVRKGMQLCVRE